MENNYCVYKHTNQSINYRLIQKKFCRVLIPHLKRLIQWVQKNPR